MLVRWRTLAALMGAFALTGLGPMSMSQAAFTKVVTVDGQAGPWDVGANPDYWYRASDALPPTIVTGLNAAADQGVSLRWLNGGVSPLATADPFVDAEGLPLPWGPYNGFGQFPSYYIPIEAGPVNLVALIAAFADDAGRLVGGPFAPGNGPASFPVPSGATTLLLGVNDNIFADNGGQWRIQVKVRDHWEAVPEPATIASLVVGLIGVAAWRRIRAGA